MMDFAIILREALDEKGWGIDDLAKATGIGKDTIKDYLKGHKPRGKRLEIVCNAVGIDPDDLPEFVSEENMTVKEAARRMNKSENFVRDCVMNGSLPGSTDERGNFHIPRKGFENYMQGMFGKAIETSMNMLIYTLREMITKANENAHPNKDRAFR